jgi:hypothetical protein
MRFSSKKRGAFVILGSDYFLWRWCTVCQEARQFQYNSVVGHSECKECGGRFGIKVPSDINNRESMLLYFRGYTDRAKEVRE